MNGDGGKTKQKTMEVVVMNGDGVEKTQWGSL